jgi:hypothetical protein
VISARLIASRWNGNRADRLKARVSDRRRRAETRRGTPRATGGGFRQQKARHREVRLSQSGDTPHIGVMQHLDLSDAALTKELADNDRYPLSPRIQTLRAILAKLRPEPLREPSPTPKVYAPPRAPAPEDDAVKVVSTRAP